MRLITWNINSLRLRMPLVRQLVENYAPDVLCLQETKVQDKDFPEDDLKALGFEHLLYRGIKSYNGVAIASRLPLSNPLSHAWTGKEDARHVAATLPDGTEVHCLYVPAGGDEPDPAVNDKFAHKLQFVDEMTAWFAENRPRTDPIVAVGDLNIAPLETDVWSHKQLLNVVSHTPVEVEKFTAAQTAFDWVDTMRVAVPEPAPLYTWWSYRARDWRAADKGRRLDHIWATPSLAPKVTRVEVLKDARGWEKPSDHAPVMADFA